jgi:c-di-GMP-binding flagellar brake protein YcgR
MKSDDKINLHSLSGSSEDDSIYAEKRKFKRIRTKVPAKIELVDSQQEADFVNLLTIDISAGGVYLQADPPLPEGTKVKLDIILPLDKLRLSKVSGHYLIKAKGKVLRCKKDGMAIIFDEDYQIYRYKKAKK